MNSSLEISYLLPLAGNECKAGIPDGSGRNLFGDDPDISSSREDLQDVHSHDRQLHSAGAVNVAMMKRGDERCERGKKRHVRDKSVGTSGVLIEACSW